MNNEELYSLPIHFKQNGKWVDIDNSLVETKKENDILAQSQQLQINTWHYGVCNCKVDNDKLNIKLYIDDKII